MVDALAMMESICGPCSDEETYYSPYYTGNWGSVCMFNPCPGSSGFFYSNRVGGAWIAFTYYKNMWQGMGTCYKVGKTARIITIHGYDGQYVNTTSYAPDTAEVSDKNEGGGCGFVGNP